MKILKTVFLLFLFKTITYGQYYKIEKVQNDYWGGIILLIENDKVVDTLSKFKFRVDLIDQYCIDKNNVAFIIKSVLFYGYFKSTFSNNEWILSKSSGPIEGSHEMESTYNPNHDHRHRSFKIIGDDLVKLTYTNPDNSTEVKYIDCKAFEKAQLDWERKIKEHKDKPSQPKED
ncbi:MAG: hypothetical protein ABIR66_04950 [Saprospiraceae bacterium]